MFSESTRVVYEKSRAIIPALEIITGVRRDTDREGRAWLHIQVGWYAVHRGVEYGCYGADEYHGLEAAFFDRPDPAWWLETELRMLLKLEQKTFAEIAKLPSADDARAHES